MTLEAAQAGTVAWITGLSGAGKSTLAAEVTRRLRQQGHVAVLVDGDVVRNIFGADLGHSPADRLTNAERIARMARFLSQQGCHVVVATMSLFRQLHTWNRANIPSYLEVYIRVPLHELKARDARGLYSRAARGEASNVVGVDLPFEEPLAPDLTLDNAFDAGGLEHNTIQVLTHMAVAGSRHHAPPQPMEKR